MEKKKLLSINKRLKDNLRIEEKKKKKRFFMFISHTLVFSCNYFSAIKCKTEMKWIRKSFSIISKKNL